MNEEVDIYPLPDWWDDSLQKDSEEIVKSDDDDIGEDKKTFETWL